MIVVDTSAWIELLRGTGSPVHRRLHDAVQGDEELCVTEVVVAELLAGARSVQQAEDLRSMLLGFTLLPLKGLDGFEQAAALYRACRWAGETIRSIADCLVAVPAIEARAPVLHSDRDFATLARHTPLQVMSLE